MSGSGLGVPRRRAAKVQGSGVLPVELLDDDDPAWESAESAAVWFLAQGLELKPHPEWWGPVMFHDAAVRAWAVANGFVHEMFPKVPDWGRLREAGVPQTSTVRARFAWLTQVRVE